MSLPPRGLGKGLEKLLPQKETPFLTLSPLEIEESPFQPRAAFSEESMEELTASIKKHGVLQPLLVRKKGEKYELIAGHRRLAAARKAGLAELPAYLLPAEETEAMTLQLVENLQREDLTPLEEARGMLQLMEKAQLTQEEVARLLGKSRSEIANTLRLLQAPPFIKEALEKKQISKAHARTLLAFPVEEQKFWLERILQEKLPVREIEKKSPEARKKVKKAQKDVHLLHLERKLEELFGTKVRLEAKKQGYCITLHLFSEEELEGLMRRLTSQLS